MATAQPDQTECCTWTEPKADKVENPTLTAVHGQNAASGQQRGISIPSSFGSFVILADAAHGKVFTRRESSSWLYGSVRHRTVVAIFVLQPAHYHSQRNSVFKLCFFKNSQRLFCYCSHIHYAASTSFSFDSGWIWRILRLLVVLLRSYSCI